MTAVSKAVSKVVPTPLVDGLGTLCLIRDSLNLDTEDLGGGCVKEALRGTCYEMETIKGLIKENGRVDLPLDSI